MPEQRGRQYHRERVGESLKEEIGVMIEGELGDPRIGLCHVTEIIIAPDNKSARVYIDVTGDEVESEETITAINAAKGYIKRELLLRLGVRHIPELHFALDKSREYGSRIDDLLGRIKKRTSKTKRNAGEKNKE
ncbi:MAG TPA: 30S ribosome-binding factor RbfA [Candidatus Angelobacter sp.]|jgi:ribosome-binding factor A|nr:30S ribosome-binding factor RbfA [Candidatus Angelobacter sp.]